MIDQALMGCGCGDREQAHCVEFEIDCDMDCVIEVYFLTLALPVQDDAAEAAPRCVESSASPYRDISTV